MMDRKMSFLPLGRHPARAHHEGMQRLLRLAFRAGLACNAAMTRSRIFCDVEGRLATPFFVRLTRAIRGPARGPVGPSAQELGREWERLLGAGPFGRITRVDPATDTAYGEIRGRCPLRGTGDLEACHRLMAYDRGLVAPLGARFVVLASQAEPGRTTCEIAIRRADAPSEDLVPAHRLRRERRAHRAAPVV